jgi:predicted amidophosphoribosyltransferase
LAHCPDHAAQFLFYARTYTARQGFEFSKTNQLILNLKKSVRASPPELHYKQQAIRRFAQEVIDLLTKRRSPDKSLTLVPMPPSKDRSHPEYDDRIEQVAQAIATQVQNVEWLPLLYMSQSIDSYHLRSGGRSPDEIYDLMQVESTEVSRYQPGSILVLLDDVLTSGAHFTAARRRLLEAFPVADVIGIFWAKAISADDFLR